MKEALRALVERQNLDATTMEAAVGRMVDGAATAAEIGAFLAALAEKGETVDEIVAAAKVLRARSVCVRASGPLVDLCGTGGDGLSTFNVSTAASFVAAAAGAKIAKHGNRAASGSVGAADVLEAAGVRLEISPEVAAEAIETLGFAFLFSPAFHPAVRNVAGPRRELGIRTVFNLIGPLCNPAGATRQLLGVSSARWLEPMTEALRRLGCERALVVHGSDGSDEITPTGPTRAVELRDGVISSADIEPSDYGIAASAVGDLVGGSAADNARMLRAVLGGEKGPRADVTALNAGAALYVAGLGESIGAGVTMARRVLAAGKAGELLERYIAFVGKAAR